MDTFIKILEKFSTRPLLYIFGGLSTCSIFQKTTALQEPSTTNISKLLAGIVIACLIFLAIEKLINKFNETLQSNDPADIGPILGSAALAVYLAFTLHYLGNSINPLNTTLLIKPGFIYSTTLLLFSFEMFKLNRFG
ncbi:hypothetical protein [Pantoea vagans]|uniref:hypothetical protein n=1 Tax=Pantoea vagans TaxID=470934 RepID=UPI000907BF13|nr:hypothetical protein [Pantoea vagans]